MPRSENWGRGSTRQSRKTRAYVLARDPICYLQMPGCTQVSTIAEHVLNRARGGTDDLTNLRGACAPCNEQKRIIEAAAGRAHTHRPVEKHPGLR